MQEYKTPFNLQAPYNNLKSKLFYGMIHRRMVPLAIRYLLLTLQQIIDLVGK